jgi:hypothetical protein
METCLIQQTPFNEKHGSYLVNHRTTIIYVPHKQLLSTELPLQYRPTFSIIPMTMANFNSEIIGHL